MFLSQRLPFHTIDRRSIGWQRQSVECTVRLDLFVEPVGDLEAGPFGLAVAGRSSCRLENSRTMAGCLALHRRSSSGAGNDLKHTTLTSKPKRKFPAQILVLLSDNLFDLPPLA